MVVLADTLRSLRAAEESAASGGAETAHELSLEMTVNGRPYALAVDTRTSLLDALRDHLHLTGSKKGCDHGQCGACTVLVDDGAGARRINACLALAVAHDGDAVTTIEGLAAGEALHPVQAAFVAHDGFQCGYCTPGQIMSALGLAREVWAGWPSWVSPDVRDDVAPGTLSGEEIRERMSGNVCRCGAYAGIFAAVSETLAAEAQAMAQASDDAPAAGDGQSASHPAEVTP